MKTTARYYGPGTDIETFPDEPLIVEHDGEVIRVETDGPTGPDYPWGSPGVSLELAEEDARELAFALLAFCHRDKRDIRDALVTAIDDIRDRLDTELDYSLTDQQRMKARIERYNDILTHLV